MNQLVLHLDKLPLYGNGWKPKVIVRTMVAHDQPMDPGVQHLFDYSDAVRAMLWNVGIIKLTESRRIESDYSWALSCNNSTVVIEYAERYDR